MDLRVWICVFSVMCCWTFCTVLSAPATEAPGAEAPAAGTPSASTDSQRSHVRTKRCSCATFMDKECVYFCHLDIIWVNTPERVVSYGLGNAPRTKRALRDSKARTSGGPRCACVREDDATCTSFCRIRTKGPAVAPKTRLLLEEWRAKQRRRARERRRARAWEGESAAS